jgi:hypothetical protein
MVVSPDAWSGLADSVHTIIVRDDRQLFVSRKRARQFRASGHLPGRRPLPHLDGKTRQCTSFAAKFCHFFVDENNFQIYDDAAKKAIKLHLGNQYSDDDSKPYATFCDNFGRLRAAIGFRDSPRAMDRYLWLVGMYMKWNKERLRPNPQINVELRGLF